MNAKQWEAKIMANEVPQKDFTVNRRSTRAMNEVSRGRKGNYHAKSAWHFERQQQRTARALGIQWVLPWYLATNALMKRALGVA